MEQRPRRAGGSSGGPGSRRPSRRWRSRARGAGACDDVALHGLGDRRTRGRGEHVVDRALSNSVDARACGRRRSGPPARRALASSALGSSFSPSRSGEVDHVERDDGRQPERDQLEREAEVIVEVRGIDHDDHRIGPPLARLLADQHVARHRFVGAGGVEAVGAGQIDQFDRAAVGERQPPRLPLDRDPGIIADLLPRAGQRVEQRALAGIGVADQRNQGMAGIIGSIWTCDDRGGVAAADARPSCGRPGRRADRGRTGRGAAVRPRRPRQSPKSRSRVGLRFAELAIQSIATIAGARRRAASWSRATQSGWKGAFIVATDYQ